MNWDEGWYREHTNKLEVVLLRKRDNTFILINDGNKILYSDRNYNKILKYIQDAKYTLVSGKIYPNFLYFKYGKIYFENKNTYLNLIDIEWCEVWIEQYSEPYIVILGKKYNEDIFYIIDIKMNEIIHIFNTYEDSANWLWEDELRLLNRKMEEI